MSTSDYIKPIPDLEDPDWAPFWAAARGERLVAQRCGNCGSLRFPPLPICDVCLDERFEWVDVATRGVIWSYVIYHRAFHPGFASELPYAVAIVENEDGLRFTGQISGEHQQLAVGSLVHAVFEVATPDFTMVKWQLDD